MADTIARLPPADAVDPAAKARLDARAAEGRPILNLHRIMAYAPELGAGYGQIVAAIRTQAATPRVYLELAIMRTATITRSHYEWVQHFGYMRECGYDEAKIEAIRDWPASDRFDPEEKAVLAFVDQLVGRFGDVDDVVFDDLKARFPAKQMTEIVMTVGCYIHTAIMTNAMRIELED